MNNKIKKYENLFKKAQQAYSKSYAPYSKFKVGAAILTCQGKIYTGANVENVSYGLSCCAERIALYSALMADESCFKAIAIANNLNNYTTPCGACRQVFTEFVDEDFKFILGYKNNNLIIYNMQELLPLKFKLD